MKELYFTLFAVIQDCLCLTLNSNFVLERDQITANDLWCDLFPANNLNLSWDTIIDNYSKWGKISFSHFPLSGSPWFNAILWASTARLPSSFRRERDAFLAPWSSCANDYGSYFPRPGIMSWLCSGWQWKCQHEKGNYSQYSVRGASIVTRYAWAQSRHYSTEWMEWMSHRKWWENKQ